jgi:hypothetical protein
MFSKSLVISLKMSLKSLNIVQNNSNYWNKPLFLFKCFKKASHHFKKASIPLKGHLESLEMFENPSH